MNDFMVLGLISQPERWGIHPAPQGEEEAESERDEGASEEDPRRARCHLPKTSCARVSRAVGA